MKWANIHTVSFKTLPRNNHLYLAKIWNCSTIPHECAWVERKYRSYWFSTSALDEGEWSASLPGSALAPGKGAPEKGAPVSIIQETGWAPEPVWTQRLREKSFGLCQGSNLNRPVIQPVSRLYTDWATPAHTYTMHKNIIIIWFTPYNRRSQRPPWHSSQVTLIVRPLLTSLAQEVCRYGSGVFMSRVCDHSRTLLNKRQNSLIYSSIDSKLCLVSGSWNIRWTSGVKLFCRYFLKWKL
jgi:hypothetical protein